MLKLEIKMMYLFCQRCLSIFDDDDDACNVYHVFYVMCIRHVCAEIFVDTVYVKRVLK